MEQDIRFEIADIVTAFQKDGVIGARVVDCDRFMEGVRAAVARHEAKADQRMSGEYFLPLRRDLFDTVTCGVGERSKNEDDYVVRIDQGQARAFLKRDFAAGVVGGLACVVYTRQAYLSNPEMEHKPEEATRISASDCTHVIVAVLARPNEEFPLPIWTLVHSLAGGNERAQFWLVNMIREKARKSWEYWSKWVMVAD